MATHKCSDYRAVRFLHQGVRKSGLVLKSKKILVENSEQVEIHFVAYEAEEGQPRELVLCSSFENVEKLKNTYGVELQFSEKDLKVLNRHGEQLVAFLDKKTRPVPNPL